MSISPAKSVLEGAWAAAGVSAATRGRKSKMRKVPKDTGLPMNIPIPPTGDGAGYPRLSMATTSQPGSLLSMARLKSAKPRTLRCICSLVRIAQTCLGCADMRRAKRIHNPGSVVAMGDKRTDANDRVVDVLRKLVAASRTSSSVLALMPFAAA